MYRYRLISGIKSLDRIGISDIGKRVNVLIISAETSQTNTPADWTI